MALYSLTNKLCDAIILPEFFQNFAKGKIMAIMQLVSTKDTSKDWSLLTISLNKLEWRNFQYATAVRVV